MHETHNESVLAEIIISRVHLDKAPVTTTIVENEMPRSRRASATTTPLSFWKTPERKLSLTLICRHVTAILIESPPVPDKELQRGLYPLITFPCYFSRAQSFFPYSFLYRSSVLSFNRLLVARRAERVSRHVSRILKIALFDGSWFFSTTSADECDGVGAKWQECLGKLICSLLIRCYWMC